MTPSPTPISAGSQVGSQQSNHDVNGMANAMPALRRPKKETTLFHKKPSRPFALAAMQAANGNATPPSSAGSVSASGSGSGLGTNVARANQVGTASRASPIPKPQGATAGPSTGGQSSLDKGSSPSGASTPPASQGSPAGATSSATAKEPEPSVPYQDFRIISTNRHDWKYDVMKFDSRKPVDVNRWARPIKLNRKELKRGDANGEVVEAAPTPVGPMLGPDGKPVIGADGRIVMVDHEGRPIHDAKPSGGPAAAAAAKPGKDDKNKKKKFQKKTRQVFLVPDHVRQLRREERYPWVMEDASGGEVWEGRMEEANKAELHALFMPGPNSVFRFVPAHRWYKFQKRRPQQHAWSLEEAEKMMAKKNRDQERWLVRQRNTNAAPSAGGSGGGSLVYDLGGGSLGPGGRRLRTVDDGMRGLFDEDDDEGVQDRRRRERERGGEGDMDEVEYEEDFADDEEKMEPDDIAADEEAKELEERLKREYRSANKAHDGYVDDDEEEEEGDNLTGVGKDIKKLVRKIEKNAAYDSDEEKNPYASSEEEEEEETTVPTPTGPAVQDQSASRPSSTPQSKSNSRPASRSGSRPGSPAPPGSGGSVNIVKVKTEASSLMLPPPASPVLGMGGHSVVAKRATSPKPPKIKGQIPGQAGNRATSPLAGPTGSRVGSPVPVSPGASRATSPAPAGSPSKKRKADGEVSGAPPGVTGGIPGAGVGGGAQPKHKKRKPIPGSSTASIPANVKSEPAESKPSAPQVAPGTELTTALLVAWLRTSPGATTRECIHYFQPCLTDDRKKANFTGLVKEVASLKGGVLALKSQYRDGIA